MVIGSAGSGKSTTARMIGHALDLPVVHIDREVYWQPGWQERTRADQIDRVKRIVAQEAWVFEGSFSRTYGLREARAEMLIWLDVPLALRLWRVVMRALRYNGQTRTDMAEDCPERLARLPGFLWFIVSTAKSSRRKARAFFDASELPRHRLTTRKEVATFVAALSHPKEGQP